MTHKPHVSGWATGVSAYVDPVHIKLAGIPHNDLASNACTERFANLQGASASTQQGLSMAILIGGFPHCRDARSKLK